MTREDDASLTPVWCLSLAQLRAELERTTSAVVGYLVDQERRPHYATADGAASVRRHLEIVDELARRPREELPSVRAEPAEGAQLFLR